MAYKIKDLDSKLLSDLKIDFNHRHQWYIVTVVSGNEQKVIENIKDKLNGYGYGDKLSDLKIIKEKIKEVKIYEPSEAPRSMKNRANTKWETIVVDGATKYRCTKIKEGNKFNGYIFLKAEMTDQIWFLIRNTQMVTGLVGSSGKNVKPIPVPEDKILKLIADNDAKRALISLNEKVDHEENIEVIELHEDENFTNFEVDQEVKIIADTFFGEIAKIAKIDQNKKIATVEFEFFGRINTLDLNFNDIQLYDEESDKLEN
ncbi:transcription termination/antitermination protein NusG [Ureaplasma parvum]|mgnify:CR=1 FL=1|uniref:Transcription termination/antitermination protein NusG n=3 Tax=Ureaplasma parvum TaxID=134821 RepID=Q9PPQ8_UREPA|nr:transcription termination/antitermination protein NusG [Ureaplasma parvum]pir/A82874/ transcription antitermination factor UU581 [imported] - Ureaplasma urealyticum [Ureaplasma urealyticum]AAF30995.1 transcription antitermination factor [Ureaplasma parvum serovar 3 str. ATCC 700970]ACA33192.1 transcription termination/antitermination factor NusG [Ureaplasma parvum serovar 3 str. ATCC 27815]ASD24657.1 transcription termination/antitermination protein NusG [Ureaplasma parvum]ASD25071.1 transc